TGKEPSKSASRTTALNSPRTPRRRLTQALLRESWWAISATLRPRPALSSSEEPGLFEQRECVVIGGAQQAHDAGGLVGCQGDKGCGVDVKLAGTAQTLETIEQNPRSGQFDALKWLLNPGLGDGGQKSGFGCGRFEPAALVAKVQLGKFHHRGGARPAVRVAVHSTRRHLDRSAACAPCGVVSACAGASPGPPKEESGALQSNPPPRARNPQSP